MTKQNIYLQYLQSQSRQSNQECLWTYEQMLLKTKIEIYWNRFFHVYDVLDNNEGENHDRSN